MSPDKNNSTPPEDSNWERDLEKAAEYVGRQELKNRLKNLEAEQQPKKVLKISFRRIAAVAAGLLFLIATAGLWYARSNYSIEKIVERHQFEPNFSGVRGESSTSVFENSIELFYQKNYSAAEKALNQIAPEQLSDRELFLKATLQFQQKKYVEAEQSFKKILTRPGTKQKAEAEWFIILSQLKSDNFAEAKKGILKIKNDARHPFQNKAEQLWIELNSRWRKLVFFSINT